MKNLVEIKENEMMETNGGVTNVTTMPMVPTIFATEVVAWIVPYFN